MKRPVLLPIAALALLITSSVSGVAHAAGSKVLTITPATVKPAVQPGSTFTGSFQVINPGSDDYPVHVYTAPYSVRTEAYTPDFTPLPGKPNPASWLHLDTAKADVGANQSLKVNYHLSVPAGTQAGGYYAVAFVETQTGKTGQGVVVNERVGEIFYIQVAGPVKQAGKLVSWSSSFLQQAPLSATLRLENDGGVHYASDIHLNVKDIFGHSKYTLDSQKEILPQTIRRIPLEWQNAPPLGLFKVGGTATIVGKTVTLPSKYVLVMSPFIRIVLLLIVAGIIILGISRRAVRKRGSAASPDRSKKPKR